LAHDITTRGARFDGDDVLVEEDTWHGILAHVGMMYGLWRPPNIPHFQPRRHTLELNVTLKGDDVTLLEFYLVEN
jgi:hypothetical protein